MACIKRILRHHKHLYHIARQIRHPLYREKKWHLITYEESFALAAQWSEILPKNFDVIIGIPRGGLLIANVLACKLNTALSTPNEFINGNVWYSTNSNVIQPKKYSRLLLIEDSIRSGHLLQQEYRRLKTHNPSLDIKCGSLFINKDQTKSNIDYYLTYQKDEEPIEWNMPTSFNMDCNVAVDLDGILCRDDNQEEPLYIPSFTVKAIITGRPEKERYETEAWLKRNNVHYKKLIMYDGTVENKTQKEVSKYKARNIIDINAAFYWESDVKEAALIANQAVIPVYCPSAHKIISPKNF
jgi:orotate phosphoribosyltransferase